MNHEKAKNLVAEAEKIALRADSWMSLSNALSDPRGGLIARYFPDRAERDEFLASAEYEQLNQLLRQTIQRAGLYPHPAGSKDDLAG